MIESPNAGARAVALGARFAVEQEFQERIVALANERDQALARAAEAEQQRDEFQALLAELHAAGDPQPQSKPETSS